MGPGRSVGPVLLLAALVASTACRRRRPQLERGEEAVVVVEPTTALPLPKGVPSVEARTLSPAEDGSKSLVLDAGSMAVRGALAVPATGPGGKGEGGGTDRYSFTLPGSAPAEGTAETPQPDQRLSVSLTAGENARLSLEVADAQSGVVMGERQVAPGQTAGFANLAARSGAGYRLSVFVPRGYRPEASDRPLEYVAVVKAAPLGPADEREPNDTAAEAMPLPPAHRAPELAGYLVDGGDQDWFRVPLGEVGAGTVLDIEVNAPPELAIGLSVATASGVEVAGSQGKAGERVFVRSLSPTALLAGEERPAVPPTEPGFFVTVQAVSGGSLDRPYVLSVRTDLGAGREREPNGTPETATPLAGGTVSASASGTDVDIFAFEVPLPGPVQASLAAGRPGEFSLEIRPPGETTWHPASGPARPALSLSVPAQKAGTAYVKVARRSKRAGGPGAYQLTLGLAPAQAQP